MKAVAMYHPYGWKARIGLIVPSTNTINEPEFYRLAPPGVAIFTSRVLLLGKMTEESYFQMAAALDRAAGEIATAEVDVVAYGCTSGSIICPLPQLLATLTEKAKAPAIATAGAVVVALRALGARRVAVGTPYVEFVNESERRFLESHGLRVVAMQGLDLGHTQEERRAIGRVPPEAVFRLARAIDRPDADAIFLSCTNLATLDVIAEIERELGKPVVTSNTACFWACLRLAGVRTPVAGHGRLLEELLEPVPAEAFTLASPARLSA